jgi:flagellar capping protein FliD
MDVAGTVVNAAVVAMVGLVLGWLGKGRFEAIDRRFEAIDRRFEAQEQRIDRLEERLEHRIDALQASLDSMRSDLTQVALAVGVRPRATEA